MATSRDETLRQIAARIDLGPSIARRSAGPTGLAVAYLPGQRLTGLRLRDDRLEVHVVMAWPATIDDVMLDLSLAVHDLWDPALVDLVVDDLALPPSPSFPSRQVSECVPPMLG